VNQTAETVKNTLNNQPQILLMEDEKSVAQGLQMILSEEGYDVDLAMTGQNALNSLSDKGFDLMVADLRLPDMNGMEVIKKAKDENPEIKVIVITGYANISSAVEAMKTGVVVDYISKPFTEKEFMERVEKVFKEKKDKLSTKDQESEGETPAEITAEEDSGTQPQVLLMEDEPSVGQGLQMVLREQGYDVDLAVTGQEALDTLKTKSFVLLVADLRLPDMNGLDVVKQVKRDQPSTKVIAISGYSSLLSRVDSMKEGVSDFLPKPFTEEEFMSAVVRTLKGMPRADSGEIIGTEDEEADRFTKIGVYVCHGGTDIASKLRVDEIVDFARKQPQVIVARSNKYLCQQAGLKMIEKNITINQAMQAEELFIAVTTKDVIPVVKFEDKIIADGKPGKYTTSLMNEFLSFTR